MQFITVAALAAASFFTTALADPHRNLVCNWNKKYDWQLTKATCEVNFKSMANYDTASGWCITNSHQRIDGDRWEGDCQAIACRGWSEYYDSEGDLKYRYRDCVRDHVKGKAHD